MAGPWPVCPRASRLTVMATRRRHDRAVRSADTVTVDVAVPVFPAASVAENVTTVAPAGTHQRRARPHVP